MAKVKHISLSLLALIILQLSLISVQAIQSEQQFVLLSWFNFKKSNEYFILSNPLTKTQIQFGIQQKFIKATNVAITTQGYWKSIYRSDSHEIRVIGKGENYLIQISTKDNLIDVSFNNVSRGQEQQIYLSTKDLEKSHFVPINQVCVTGKNNIVCKFENQPKLYISYHASQNLEELLTFIEQRQLNDSLQITQFMESLNIKSNNMTLTQKMAKSMLTHSLSSLCVEESQYEGFQFYGLCSNSNTKQIERHYSLLVVDILFKYNPGLAIWLVQNFIDLLQEKLFYSFKGRQWIPVPEHVEVFATYLKFLKENSSLPAESLRKKINKVIEIQNGLINRLLLSEVNHLSEEINYRQNNKVHPTILKMLNQVWKTDLPRARVSSIYAESFTNDFFYHEQNEKLQTSVGKMIWLIKLINQHIKLIINYGDSYQKESLQQLVSLSKVMHGYVLDDPKAQNGDFYSIVLTQNMRVYTRSVGYESLLPFAYDISPTFPTNTMMNLTSSIGLVSLPLTHHKVRQTYNFRGNINLYFNYKILFNMIQRSNENPRFKVYFNGLKTVIESLQRLIQQSYVGAEKLQSSDYFTSWNPQGKGVTSQNYLAVLNLAFLKNLDSNSQNIVPNDKQAKKNQEKTQNVK